MPQRHGVDRRRVALHLDDGAMEPNVYLLMAAALAYSGYMLIAMRS